MDLLQSCLLNGNLKNPLHESHIDMSDCCVRFSAWNQPAITAYLFYRHDFQFYFRQGLPQSQIPGSPYAGKLPAGDTVRPCNRHCFDWLFFRDEFVEYNFDGNYRPVFDN